MNNQGILALARPANWGEHARGGRATTIGPITGPRQANLDTV